MVLTKDAYIKIKEWVYRQARPIEWARWRYHFEESSQADVLKCLKVYQNSDGGFGRGLEADSLNPASSPITTSQGISILKEIDFMSREDEMR